MHGEIADRSDRKIQLQWLPVVTVVEADIDAEFSSSEEQSTPNRVFANGVDERALGNSLPKRLPCLAAIASAIDVRPHILDAVAINGSVGGLLVKMRGVDNADFAPRGKLRRRYVFPVFAIIEC